jgi:hypothetical protein
MKKALPDKFKNPLLAHFALAAAILGAGCTSAPPTIDTAADAAVTFDGLYPVKGARADEAWARPDIDLTQYKFVMLQGAGIEYRPGGESGRTFYSRSQGGHFEVTENQKAALRQIMVEAFLGELGNSEVFSLVGEPGPEVLLVRGALLDVVSYVPPDPVGGRSDIYLSKVAEATLVLELRDSITEAILARSVDRRAAESAFNFSESNRVTNTSEVRRLASYWAKRLREILDEFGAPAE